MIEENELKKQLNSIFRWLQQEGRASSRKDFAQLLGLNYYTVVKAMNGDEKALTPSLVAKAKALMREDSHQAPPPPEPVTIPGETAQMFRDMAETIRRQEEHLQSKDEDLRAKDRTIDRLISILEAKDAQKGAQSSAS